ncbi:15463_t:CDS:2, partial [Cetraspora pellucida]
CQPHYTEIFRENIKKIIEIKQEVRNLSKNDLLEYIKTVFYLNVIADIIIKTITDNYHIYDSEKVKCKLCTEFFDIFLINTMRAHIETQHHEFYLVEQAIPLLTHFQVFDKETLSDISKLGITNIETEENSVLDFKNLTIKGLFKNDLRKYNNEFEQESYEKIYRQPFDSIEKFTFLRLHYNTLKKRKEALKKIETKREEIPLEGIEKFDQYYDTYSDNQTCYYRTVAYENNFELVGWYEINASKIFNMLITFNNIKKIDYFEEPKLLLLYWDIEKSSSQ